LNSAKNGGKIRREKKISVWSEKNVEKLKK
jgi:hypothetical protein